MNMLRILIVFIFVLSLTGCMNSWDSHSTTYKVDGVVVEVPVEIDGEPVPPDPGEDGTETLLGIDSNANGVRDDVERWIYAKYQNSHPIVRQIALQAGRAAQIIIQEPEKAMETTDLIAAAQDCNYYFRDYANLYGDSILVDHYIFNKEFKNVQFNTPKRVKAYLEHDSYLSGGVFPATPISKKKSRCHFNIDEFLSK